MLLGATFPMIQLWRSKDHLENRFTCRCSSEDIYLPLYHVESCSKRVECLLLLIKILIAVPAARLNQILIQTPEHQFFLDGWSTVTTGKMQLSRTIKIQNVLEVANGRNKQLVGGLYSGMPTETEIRSLTVFLTNDRKITVNDRQFYLGTVDGHSMQVLTINS